MKAKFPKSNISISGELYIHWNDGIEHHLQLGLNPLNQSKSGIYCLRNKFNDRLYIGMARNLAIRKDRHFRDLAKNEHANFKIQKDYLDISVDPDSFGDRIYSPDEVFEFEVIIYCRPSELTFYENLLIKHLNPYYNVHKQKQINRKFDVNWYAEHLED